MATDAGKIVVSLEANVKDLQKGIRSAQTGLKNFGNSTKNFIAANKLAITAGVGAFVAGIAKVTKAASDLEETQGKFNTVFRGSLEEAEKFAQELQDGYATSEEEAKRFLSTIQDTLVPMGLARAEATNLSSEVVKLAADLGSFNNMPTAAVVRDIQSAMVGNLETTRKYGVSLRAAAIDQAILEKGIAKTKDEITEAQRVQERLTQIMAGSADAVGDMARTANSFANRMKKLGAETNNLMATLGSFTIGPGRDMVTVLTDFVTRLNDGIKSIQNFSSEFESFTAFLEANFIAVIGSIALAVLDILGKIPFVSRLIKALGGDLEKTKAILEDQIVAWNAAGQGSEQAGQKAKETENEKRNQIQETTAAIQAAEEERAIIDEVAVNARIERFIKEKQAQLEEQTKFRDAMMITTKAWTSFATKTTQSLFDQFGQGVADMILENRKFSDVIKRIWKDLARAVIAEIAKMIAKWLAFLALRGVLSAFGGPAGGALAGIIAGAGRAQKGGIIGEPSMVTGLRTGRTILAGEAGKEAIVPLGSQNAPGRLTTAEEMGTQFSFGGGGNGGGGTVINVNISGSFLEGNENKWQRLIRERVVPEIQRFTMSRPIGPFERKRGVI